MTQDDCNYLPPLRKLLRKSGMDDYEVVQKNRAYSASIFYEFRKLIQGQPINPSIAIEITSPEQVLHRAGSSNVDDFLRLKMKNAGVAIP